MRCKPGDLAVIVGMPQALSEARDKIVRLTNEPPMAIDGEIFWKLAERVSVVLTGNGTFKGETFWIGESVWFDQLKDENLLPIRDPGEDAKDETLSWLPVPLPQLEPA